MALKRYTNGAWTDIDDLKRYNSGAFASCESAKAYKNGAWEEVWGSAIAPYGLYIYSTTYNTAKIVDKVITMTAKYANRASEWARIIIPSDGASVTELEMDYLLTNINGTTGKISLNIMTSDNIYTGTLTSDNNYTDVASVFNLTNDSSKAENGYKISFNSKKYIYVQLQYMRNSYNSAYANLIYELVISKLKINGKTVKGNMEGVMT